jgi:SAM-dependent methyltransferase
MLDQPRAAEMGAWLVTVGAMARSPETSAEFTARRAASFGREAAAYAAERPEYPDAAIRWALAAVRDRSPLRVLDLAAGTGKLTQGLLRTGAEVVAVEPDQAMLAELHRLLPHVPALAGTAERIPLSDGAVDAILVGQAMHWFDLDRAMPEMARVLAPGGVLAGLWNTDDVGRAPWIEEFRQVTGIGIAQTDGHGELEPTTGFPAFEQRSFQHFQRRTAESLVATLATHSRVLVKPAGEREEFMARVLAYLRTNPATANGEFDLPLATLTIRAVRAG